MCAIAGSLIDPLRPVLRHNSERYSSVKVLLVLASLLEILGLDIHIARFITDLLYDLPNSRMQELEGAFLTILCTYLSR